MTTRRELHQAIGQLNDEQVRQVITVVERLVSKHFDSVDPVYERLKRIPGIQLPAHWPRRFETVERLCV